MYRPPRDVSKRMRVLSAVLLLAALAWVFFAALAVLGMGD